MKKRIFALVLALGTLVSLCSCGKYSDVKVNGVKIHKGTYSYFLDRAKAANKDADANAQKEIANDMTVEYVAVNSEFSNRGLSLTTARKAAVSQSVDSAWNLFSAYYTDIGVSKQDLYEIEQNKAFREELMIDYYSQSGIKPVADDELKAYFYNNFVAFRAITGYLTIVDQNKQTVAMPEEQRQAMIASFSEKVSQINEMNTTFDEVAAFTENVVATSEIQVITKGDAQYPESFFENAVGVAPGNSVSFAIDSYVFIVERNDITSEDLQLFETYRTDALKAMKGEEFNLVVDSWKQCYTAS